MFLVGGEFKIVNHMQHLNSIEREISFRKTKWQFWILKVTDLMHFVLYFKAVFVSIISHKKPKDNDFSKMASQKVMETK